MLQFCRFLRQNQFRITTDEEQDILQALPSIGLRSGHEFRLVLRTILCKDLSQLHRFDDLYTQYWKELERAVNSKIKEQAVDQSKPKPRPPSLQVLKDWLHGGRNSEATEMVTYSPGGAGNSRDFSSFAKDELHEILRVINQLAQRMAQRPSRRRQSSRKLKQLDLRRTLRNGLRFGGEIVELRHSEPKQRNVRLVLLCDVSRSMELYTRFLIQVLYGFQRTGQRVESFIFSSTLERTTRQLREQDFAKALRRLTQESTAWSGGTEIGLCLNQFVEQYGRRLLDKDTIVLILSDGLDTGNIDVLQRSMHYLQQKAYQVFWLNPLAGRPGYEPTVRGMQAALPYVDHFLAAHDVESLRNLRV
ncbi:MAG: VWA domain-containing protein [Bacteroidota bacterium]